MGLPRAASCRGRAEAIVAAAAGIDLIIRPQRQPARLVPQGERGGRRKRLLFALRHEPADGAYGTIATAVDSVPPALEVTVIDGGKVDAGATGPEVSNPALRATALDAGANAW